MYSTGTSSSYLGTKSPGFVLNWIPKFSVGNKKPRFCTQPDPKVRSWEQKGLFSYSTETQTICSKPDIPDCPFISPNSCTSIGLLGFSRAGQCAARGKNGRCCTSIGLLGFSRAGQCAARGKIGRCCTSTGLLRLCWAGQCAATLETELRRAVTVGVLHVNWPSAALQWVSLCSCLVKTLLPAARKNVPQPARPPPEGTLVSATVEPI